MISSKARVTKGAEGGYYVNVARRWSEDDGERQIGLMGPMERRTAQALARALNEVLSAGQRAVRQYVNRGL